MCTAITYKTKDTYFGRNLDLEYSYKETVTIMPRNYSLTFSDGKKLEHHYALIGMAYVCQDYPLYYDAINEKGLAMAGLNFPNNAYYHEKEANKNNVAPFEFINWVLTQYTTVDEVKEVLTKTNIVNLDFSEDLKASPLHWLIADKEKAITVESMEDGLHVYDNLVGVLTNNPPFNIQMFNLNNYMSLSTKTPLNNFSKKIKLDTYSRGMGALGLPGDLSSASRFVKATFTKLNSLSGDLESESLSQFFHILNSVDQQRGCVVLENNKYEITIYSSGANLNKGLYYYKTYENSQITCVNMHNVDLESHTLTNYDLIKGQQIKYQN